MDTVARHEHSKNWWDGLGVSLSAICLIHCLSLPLLSGALSFFHHFHHNSDFHIWMAVLIIPIASLAFWRGYRNHHDLRIVSLGILASSLLVAGLWTEPDYSTLITVGGSTILVIAHLWNWRASRCGLCPTTSESRQ